MKPSLPLKKFLNACFHSVALGSLALTTATGTLMIGAALYTLTSTQAQASITVAGGDSYTIEEGASETTDSLTLGIGSTLTNKGSLTITSSITTESASSDPTYIYNEGEMIISGSSSYSIDNYNIFSNGDDATLTITATKFILKANAQIINTGSGTVNIDALQYTFAGKLTNAGSGTVTINTLTNSSTLGTTLLAAGATGNIIINSATLASTTQTLNQGSGDIIISTAALSASTVVTNSNDGNIAFGVLSFSSSVTMTNSGTGDLYVGSGSVSSGSTISNIGSGTLSIGTAYTYTDDEGAEVTLVLNSAVNSSLTLSSSSSITNAASGTLSLDSIIVLGGEELITNYGTLEFGDSLVFDVSSLITGTETYVQIFSTDSNADLSELTIDNLSGYAYDDDYVTVTFNSTGGVTININPIPTYNGSGGDISLSTVELADGSTFSSGGALIFSNPEGSTGTVTNLSIDMGEDTSISTLSIDDNYTLTLTVEGADDKLSIGTLSLSSSSKLTLESDQISIDSIAASSGAAITFGGENQNYTVKVTDAGGFNYSSTLTEGNTLTIVDETTNGEQTSFTLGLTAYSGSSAETATTLAIAEGANLQMTTTSITFVGDGYFTFDIGKDAILYNYKVMSVDNYAITFTKEGEGDLIIDYRMDSASNSELIINAGTVTMGNSATNFAKITINEGATLSTFDKDASWAGLAEAIEMNGGTLKEGYGDTTSTLSGAQTANFTLSLTGDNTLDLSNTDITSFTFTEAISSGSTEISGNLNILGSTGLSIALDKIENLNGTITSDGKSSLSVASIDNEAGYTTNFVGDIDATELRKAGDGNATFESLSVSDSILISDGGSITVSESLSVGGLTISQATVDSSVSPIALLSNLNSTDSGITITYNGKEGESGSITGSTLTAISISDATINSDSDITLDTVDLSNVSIEAANVTLDNIGDMSVSSISTANLTVNDISSSNGLSIDDENGLTYTITALDGLSLSLTGELTLNLDLTEDEQLVYNNAIASGQSVSIVLSDLGNSMDASTLENLQLAITLGEGTTIEIDSTSIDASGNIIVSSDVIPEPSSSTLSLLALAGLLARRRRKS